MTHHRSAGNVLTRDDVVVAAVSRLEDVEGPSSTSLNAVNASL